MSTTYSLDEFRKNLSDIVAGVMYGNQIVRVQKHSKSGVVVMSEKEYEVLKDPRKKYTTKKDWDNIFMVADDIKKNMTVDEQKGLEKILDDEIQVVRQKKK